MHGGARVPLILQCTIPADDIENSPARYGKPSAASLNRVGMGPKLNKLKLSLDNLVCIKFSNQVFQPPPSFRCIAPLLPGTLQYKPLYVPKFDRLTPHRGWSRASEHGSHHDTFPFFYFLPRSPRQDANLSAKWSAGRELRYALGCVGALYHVSP